VAFVIEPVTGRPTGKYKILCGADSDLAVTLVTGDNLTPDVAEADRVLDLQADGTPIALVESAPAAVAQIWSFVPVAEWPLADGTYKIINSETNTVLGFVGDAEDAPVLGQASTDGLQANRQKWKVTKLPDRDCYTFESVQIPGRFLGAPNAVPPVAVALTARAAGDRNFAIRKDPNSYNYKIFLAPANDDGPGVSRLAVNLARLPGAGNPVRPHGATDPDRTGAARLDLTPGAQTQTWVFY